MNKTILIGRLTKDPDVRYTQGDNGMCIARYTLAVDRAGKKKEGQPSADFIPCVAFGKNAEFVEKYVKKGTKLAISGHIQTGSYTGKDGNKVYTTDVIIESQEFAESKGGGESNWKAEPQKKAQSESYDGFMSIPDGIDDELPFA